MRLRLVPDETNFDFFSRWKLWLGIAALLSVVALGSFAARGLNFGIDLRGLGIFNFFIQFIQFNPSCIFTQFLLNCLHLLPKEIFTL